MLFSDVMAANDEAMRAFSTGSSSFAILNVQQRFDVSTATGPPKKMAGSAREVNGQGRVLNPPVAAVGAGSNGRAPFSSTWALANLLVGWTSLAQNEMQGFSSE